MDFWLNLVCLAERKIENKKSFACFALCLILIFSFSPFLSWFDRNKQGGERLVWPRGVEIGREKLLLIILVYLVRITCKVG